MTEMNLFLNEDYVRFYPIAMKIILYLYCERSKFSLLNPHPNPLPKVEGVKGIRNY
jgi:hypothetical protein